MANDAWYVGRDNFVAKDDVRAPAEILKDLKNHFGYLVCEHRITGIKYFCSQKVGFNIGGPYAAILGMLAKDWAICKNLALRAKNDIWARQVIGINNFFEDNWQCKISPSWGPAEIRSINDLEPLLKLISEATDPNMSELYEYVATRFFYSQINNPERNGDFFVDLRDVMGICRDSRLNDADLENYFDRFLICKAKAEAISEIKSAKTKIEVSLWDLNSRY